MVSGTVLWLPLTSGGFWSNFEPESGVTPPVPWELLHMARHLIRSDQTLKAIRPGDPRKRISDGEGLYLFLFVNGGSHGWRFTYSFHGRRKLLSLGTYPATGLALARQKAERPARRWPTTSIRVRSARTTGLPFARNGLSRTGWPRGCRPSTLSRRSRATGSRCAAIRGRRAIRRRSSSGCNGMSFGPDSRYRYHAADAP